MLRMSKAFSGEMTIVPGGADEDLAGPRATLLFVLVALVPEHFDEVVFSPVAGPRPALSLLRIGTGRSFRPLSLPSDLDAAPEQSSDFLWLA